MNKFELFTMVFYALDAQWHKNKRSDLGNFLSSMNPFWWGDIGSADPAIYVEANYELGRIYLAQRKYDKAYKTFNEILDIYDRYGTMLPGAYKKLCIISLEQIPTAKLQEIQQ